jgi:hypothetical protein
MVYLIRPLLNRFVNHSVGALQRQPSPGKKESDLRAEKMPALNFMRQEIRCEGSTIPPWFTDRL